MAKTPTAGALGKEGATLEGVDCDEMAKHAKRTMLEEFEAFTSRVKEGEDHVGVVTTNKAVLTYNPSWFC